MLRIFKRLLHETIEIVPAFIFFCVAFNLIVLTDMLTTERYGIKVFDFMSATILAVVVSKVMLAVNLLPWINAFRNRPLIFNTLWRAAFYTVTGLVLKLVELLIRYYLKHGNFVEGCRQLANDFNWPRFLAVQIWLAALFLVFAVLQEISRALGPGRLQEIFFARRK